MPLIDVLRKINQSKRSDFPEAEQTEANREMVLIRGVLHDLLEDESLDETQKQALFNTRLQDLMFSQETHVTNASVLQVVNDACKEAEVRIKLTSHKK